jgi:cystinosin
MDLSILSGVFGWIYFLAWSISFSPQIYLNHSTKSVEGLSLEYQLYNFTGFLAYSIYTIVGYQEEIAQPETSSSIKVNDIAFAVHAFVCTLYILYQINIYKKKDHPINRYHLLFNASLWVIAFVNIFLAIFGLCPWYSTSNEFWGYGVVKYLGLAKAMISFVKYFPQAFKNYTRKSTEGWSIHNVLLDFTGGSCSFAQMFVDVHIHATPDWTVFTSNVPKLILAVESILFDIIFLLQHYVLYGDTSAKVDDIPFNELPLDSDEEDDLVNSIVVHHA